MEEPPIYRTTATLDDGTRTYFGDVNDDGAVDTMDILDMLGDFGCSTCGDSDLDDDGFSGVSDLLLLLGLI